MNKQYDEMFNKFVNTLAIQLVSEGLAEMIQCSHGDILKVVTESFTAFMESSEQVPLGNPFVSMEKEIKIDRDSFLAGVMFDKFAKGDIQPQLMALTATKTFIEQSGSGTGSDFVGYQ